MAKKEPKGEGLFSPALIARLLVKPKVKTVYVNDAGDWLFCKRPGYEPFESSEILAEANKTV